MRDLKQGIDAVEERARVEMGMIKPDELFYQVIDKNAKDAAARAAAPTALNPVPIAK